MTQSEPMRRRIAVSRFFGVNSYRESFLSRALESYQSLTRIMEGHSNSAGALPGTAELGPFRREEDRSQQRRRSAVTGRLFFQPVHDSSRQGQGLPAFRKFKRHNETKRELWNEDTLRIFAEENHAAMDAIIVAVCCNASLTLHVVQFCGLCLWGLEGRRDSSGAQNTMINSMIWTQRGRLSQCFV